MSNVVPHQRHPWQEWAKQISAAWQKGVASIVETGQLLIDAQNDPGMKHGSWESMVQSKLPFSPSAARMLIAIAKHPTLSKREHANALPPKWDTLYKLSRLEPETIEAYIKDGTVTPKLERKDAVKLLPPPKKRSSKKKSSPDLNKARAGHVAAAQHLSKEERKDEVFRLMTELGLKVTDFYQEFKLGRG